MKTRTAIIIGVVTLIIGIAMLLCNNMFGSHSIVMSGGILLTGAGVINFLVATCVTDGEGRRKAKGAPYIFAMLISLAAVAVGTWVICTPAKWIPYIPFLFGILTSLGAIILFYEIIRGIHPAKAPGWLYIPATLTVVAAAADFFLKTPSQDNIMFIVTGTAFVLFGTGMTVCGSITGVHNRHQRKLAAQTPTTDASADAGVIRHQPLEADDKDSHAAD